MTDSDIEYEVFAAQDETEQGLELLRRINDEMWKISNVARDKEPDREGMVVAWHVCGNDLYHLWTLSSGLKTILDSAKAHIDKAYSGLAKT